MTIEQVKSDIQFLYAKLSARDQKYARNLNRFLNNGNRRESIRQSYVNPLAYYVASTDVDTGILPAINVGRSIALTLQSKLIQTKGRIFFDSINGTWETLKLVRNAQTYFDQFLDLDQTAAKVRKSVLDALVFDVGVILVDGEKKCTERIKPWEFFIDPAEVSYGQITRAMIQQDQYPVSAIANPTDRLKRELEENPSAKCTFYRYFDLTARKQYQLADTELIREVELSSSRLPFAWFYYQEPFKGWYSTSVIDNVYPNQRQIDDILVRIHEALTLSPANTIYVPEGNYSSIAKMISNKVGNIVPYAAGLGGVVVSTPPPIDQSYNSFLEFFIRQSYEQEGVSMLSAQSKKPSGINSGVALDTLQDVESERFQAAVDQLIEFQRNIYDIMIDVYPEKDDILPKARGRANVKWGEIKRNREKFSLQSSLASVLSKDPKVKMEQIEKLQAQGVIPAYMVPTLLQIPDIDRAYAAANASFDSCQKIIERALDQERFDFYDIIDLNQLLTISANTLMQLDSVDEDPAILDRLVKLIGVIVQRQQTQDGINNPMQPPPPPPALDGATLKAVADVVAQVQAGVLTPDAAAQIITASGLPIEQANLMVGITPQPVPGPDQNAGGVAV